MKKIPVTAAGLLIASAMSSPAQAEEVVLASDSILTIVKGKRLAGERVGGGQVRMRFQDDGTLSVQDGHAVETGKWSVQDGKLCIQVAKWNFDGCGKVARSGNLITQYFPSDDRPHIVFGK